MSPSCLPAFITSSQTLFLSCLEGCPKPSMVPPLQPFLPSPEPPHMLFLLARKTHTLNTLSISFPSF